MNSKIQNSHFFLIGIFVYASLLIISCKTQDAPIPPASITRELPAKDTVEVDSLELIDIKYQFKTANENIKLAYYQTSFYLISPSVIQVNYQFQIRGFAITDSIQGNVDSYTFSDKIMVPDTVKNNQLFKVVTSISDKKNGKATNSFYFKIKKTNLKTYYTDTSNIDRIANRAVKRNDCLFPSLPAYDFVNKTVLPDTADAASIDMLNTTVIDTTKPNYANFAHGWKSLNSTLFVKADTSTFKFDLVTIEDAERAFLKGTPSNTINNAAKNDVYVIKLRGGKDYMIMKINEIIDDNLTVKQGGDNCDYIQFNFKKK